MTSRQAAVSLMMPADPGCSQFVQAIMGTIPVVRSLIAQAATESGERLTGRVVIDVYVAPPWMHRKWRSVDVLGSASTVSA